MVVKRLSSYIQFIDWFFLCLSLYIVLFAPELLLSYIQFINWYFLCLDLYIVSFDMIVWFCTIIYLYPVLWSILYLLRPVWCFSFDFFLWRIYLLLFLREVITLYDSEILNIFYPGHWLTPYLLRSLCCFFSFEFL